MAEQFSLHKAVIAQIPNPVKQWSFWKSTQFKALAALVAVYIIWGTTMGAMRFGVETIPPSLFALSRFLLVSVFMLGIARSRKEKWPTKPEVRRHAISGILLFTLGNAAAIWAVQYIPTVLGAALMATTPFWMIGLAASPIFGRGSGDKLAVPAIIGVVLGFSGIMAILAPQLLSEFNGGGSSHFGFYQWISIIGMLSTSAFWALGSLYAKHKPTTSSIPMQVGLQNLSAAIAMLPFCLPDILSGKMIAAFSHMTQLSFFSLLYLVLVGTMVAVPCYFYTLKHLPMAVSSTFAYVSPVITMILGYCFLQESLSSTMSLGTGLILAGVILVQSFKSKAKTMAEPTPIRPAPMQQEVA